MGFLPLCERSISAKAVSRGFGAGGKNAFDEAFAQVKKRTRAVKCIKIFTSRRRADVFLKNHSQV